MKNIILINSKKLFLLGMILCLLTLPFSCSSNSSSLEDNLLTTYQVEQENNLLLLNGVTDKNKEELANHIFEDFHLSNQEKSIKYTDSDFVDADKYCYLKEGFDSTLCWCASSSNILRISSWGDDFINPIVKDTCSSYEDDLFSFFTASFTDKGNLSQYALSYYFDGILGSSTPGGATLIQQATELKPSLGSSFKGYMPEICSFALASSVMLEDNPEYLNQIEKLDEQAIELSIMKINTETKETIADSGHSLTLTGALIDQTKQGNERYIALLIADSDNESSADDLPTSLNDANKIKREKENSYTLYFTDTFDGKFGFYYGDNFATITELTCLPFKNETAIANCSETNNYATCNVSTNADLIPTFFSVYGEDNYSYVYKINEPIYLTYFFINRNELVSFTKENAKKDILENEIRIYRDDVYIGSIKDNLSYDLSSPINPKGRVINQITLTDSSFFTSLGEYKVKLVLNTNECEEAYTLNNESEVISFTIQ